MKAQQGLIFLNFIKSGLYTKTKEGWDAEGSCWEMDDLPCLLFPAFKGRHLKSMLHAAEVLSILQGMKDHICNTFLNSRQNAIWTISFLLHNTCAYIFL